MPTCITRRPECPQLIVPGRTPRSRSTKSPGECSRPHPTWPGTATKPSSHVIHTVHPLGQATQNPTNFLNRVCSRTGPGTIRSTSPKPTGNTSRPGPLPRPRYVTTPTRGRGNPINTRGNGASKLACGPAVGRGTLDSVRSRECATFVGLGRDKIDALSNRIRRGQCQSYTVDPVLDRGLGDPAQQRPVDDSADHTRGRPICPLTSRNVCEELDEHQSESGGWKP